MFQQHVARPVDFGREIVGTAVIGVHLHHEAVVRRADRGFVGPRPKPKDFISLRHGHVPAAAARRTGLLAAHRVAPIRMEPVEVGFEQACAVRVGGAALAQLVNEVGDGELGEPHARESSG